MAAPAAHAAEMPPPQPRKRRRDTDAVSRERANEQKRLRRASGEQTLAYVLHKTGMAALDSEQGDHQENISWDTPLRGGFGVSKKHAFPILRLMELTGRNSETVASWVMGQGRPERCRDTAFNLWDAEVRRHIIAGIQSVYFRAPLESIAYALDSGHNEVYAASKYVMEWRLFHWLVEQTCDRGVAPGSFDMFAAATRFIPDKAPAGVQDALRGPLSEGNRTAYAWLASFRQRWGGTKGKLPTGEDDAPPDKVGKDLRWT